MAQPSERLQFSEETREYFGQELNYPSVEKAAQFKARTSEVSVEVFYLEKGGWRLCFEFPEPVSFEEKMEGNSLYLSFNKGIDSPNLANAGEKLGYLLQTFSYGYHTLYMVGSRDVVYHIESSEKSIAIDVLPDESHPFPSNQALQTACARLLVEERRYEKAFSALDSLDAANKDTAVLLAELESLQPRWQKQVQALDRALATDPFDEDLQTLKCQAFSPHSSFVLYERQLQDTKPLAAVQVNRMQGEAIVKRNDFRTLYLGAEYQMWRGHLSQITNNLGEAVGFRGTRNQGTVYLRNEWARGVFCTGKFYLQEQNVYGLGVEAGCVWPLIQGDFLFSANWNRPCWEIFEALAYHGREDAVRLHLNSVVNRYFNWQAGIGGRRIGITHTPTGYASILAEAQLFWNLIITNPVISLNYGYEAEYVEYLKQKTGIDGTPFNPVPLTSFDFHSLRAYAFYIWRERWFATIYLGETFNRLGIMSLTAGIELKYQLPCFFDIRLSADRFPSQVAPGTQEDLYTASATARF